MEFEGVVQNGVVVPTGECALPDGSKVRISSVSESNDTPRTPRTIWEKLSELGRLAEQRDTSLPVDLADNHDHYLHGRPKHL